MIRLVDQVTGETVTIPNAWTRWTIGDLHFERITVGDRRRVIQWRRRGEGCWHALNLEAATERSRQTGLRGWAPMRRAS